MTLPTRRDRLAAERQARRSRARRRLTAGTLGTAAAVAAVLSGVAPASASDAGQPATSYQDWSYQTESSGYQLASYSSGSETSSGFGAVIDWAVATANDPSVGYAYGGNGPSFYDCSGFTQNAFAQAGIDLPRTSGAQFAGASQYVGLDELQVGDLVFWSNNGSSSGIYHVAVYIGDGKIAHARNYTEGVSVTDVDYSPWNMMGTAARY